MRISDWSSDVCSSDLFSAFELTRYAYPLLTRHAVSSVVNVGSVSGETHVRSGTPYGMTKAAMHQMTRNLAVEWAEDGVRVNAVAPWYIRTRRSEEHTSELQSLMRISYAVFCLKKKTKHY